MMDDGVLTRLRALAEQATPGPYRAAGVTRGHFRIYAPGCFFGETRCAVDQEFIAACDPQTILALLEEVAALRARLDDATRFCPGEWPCEASTSAASLERERNELVDEMERLRDKKMREAMEGVLAHADTIEAAVAAFRERAAQVAEEHFALYEDSRTEQRRIAEEIRALPLTTPEEKP